MIAIFMSSILLAGCGETTQKNNADKQDEVPTAIDAVLDIPEKGKLEEEIALAVTVTQGKDFVEDANEVEFEIWKDGQKNASEMIEAKHTEKGKYVANYTFPEDGIYNVQSHVTARDMHTMPNKSIQIGDVEAGQHEHAEGSDEHSHDHHPSDVSIHLEKPDHIQTDVQTNLAVHLEKAEQPLTKANVRLEIFQQGANPAWVDVEEAEQGEYKTNYQFPAKGKYTVRVHVKNDEGLHEHTEVEVTVE